MATQYIELICSLPYLANPFVPRRAPISRVQLNKRLSMLDFGDRALLGKLTASFYWGGISAGESDSELVRRARRTMDLVEYNDMREWLLWRMDLRTLVAALRRRHRGEDVPPAGTAWGFGRYTRHIERNWNHPHFRLEQHFTWLPEARQLLERGESHELERLLLGEAWSYYSSRQASDDYSFSAVWLYLMRWDLVDRWTSYNAEHARQRFDELVNSAMQASLLELEKIA